MELRVKWISRICVILLILKGAVLADHIMKLSKERVKEFSDGKLFYRTLYLDIDKDVLYVGAMDAIFMLNLPDVNHTTRENVKLDLKSSSNKIDDCLTKGKSELFDCHNHIKAIQPITKDQLYICGTNAFSPEALIITKNLIRSPKEKALLSIGYAEEQCSSDPTDNFTAVWVTNDNTNNSARLYYGGNLKFGANDAAIIGSNFSMSGFTRDGYVRTLFSHHEWLHKPNFVGSFVIGEYVYFFLREKANGDKNSEVIHSRVARVCIRDEGRKKILTTFSKARLNCSNPGEVPFYFDEIQSIYKSPDDDSHFYGTFIASTNNFTGSAICLFHIDDILNIFNIESNELSMCSQKSMPFPVSRLAISAVPTKNGGPIFSLPEVLLTKLAIDKLKIDFAGKVLEYTVYYAGTNNGQVHRIVHWIESSGESRTKVDLFDATHGEPIQAMAISKDHRSLYVTSDYRIVQIYLAKCSKQYENCYHCARDPYCGWNNETNTCESYSAGLIQNVPGDCTQSNRPKESCECSKDDWKLTKREKKTKKKKKCRGNCLICVFEKPEVQNNLTWYHDNTKKGRYLLLHKNSDEVHKYSKTVDNKIFLYDVIKIRDIGVYECKIGNRRLCKFNVWRRDTKKNGKIPFLHHRVGNEI